MRLYSLLIAIGCFAAPALGQSVEEERRIISVPLAGVRLQDPQSLTELRRRIDRAVRRVCGPDGTTLHDHIRARSCRVEAHKGAERQLAYLIGYTRMAELQQR